MDQVQAGEQKNNEDLNSHKWPEQHVWGHLPALRLGFKRIRQLLGKDYYPLSSSSCQNESNDK
jgi:hypothetical protein